MKIRIYEVVVCFLTAVMLDSNNPPTCGADG